MPATRLCRTDAGKMIDQLNRLSELMENLGLESGILSFTAEGDIHGEFMMSDNKLYIDVEHDGRKEAVDYDK